MNASQVVGINPVDGSEIRLRYNPWYYMLNGKLIKKMKPCLPDNYVHISTNEGCYRVHDVKLDYFVIMKNRQERKITWDKYVCLKGEGTSEIVNMRKALRQAETMLSRQSQTAKLQAEALRQAIKDSRY